MSHRRSAAFVRTIVLVVVVAAPLAAQNVIDQQQTTIAGNFSAVNAWTAQTFTPGGANVSGAGAYLTRVSGPAGPVTLALWSGNPSSSGSRELATVTTTSGVQSAGWVDVFWSPVAVTVGRTYWLLVGGGSDQGLQTTFGQSSADYANGNAYYNASTDVRSTYGNYAFYDLVFRTYTSVGVAVVPEPSTWALLGAGLVVLGGIAARRRRTATTA